MTPENPSIQVAQRVVATLVEMGVRRFAFSPGSRNAPFAYVLDAYRQAGRVRVYPFAEERGAAFWAIGAMRADPTCAPVAVVTTSGTAAAELHPALEEAKHTGLPLIAVTSDRPFEVMGTGASQTTEQMGLFGPTVVADASIPALEVAGAALLHGVSTQVTRLVAAAKGVSGQAGPVHLNVAFREPLVPGQGTIALNVDERAPAVPRFLTPEGCAPEWDSAVEPGLRTVIVAGDIGTEPRRAEAAALVSGAARIGVPLLAEPSSGLTHLPNWIPHAPWVVPTLADQVEQVVVLGKPTLSRPLTALLAREDVRKVVVSGGAPWPDPAGTATVVTQRLAPPVGDRSVGWLPVWRRHAEVVEDVLAEEADQFTQLEVARTIWRGEAGADLWLGASGAIRAFEIAAPSPGVERVQSNRGLAGIDGTVASALGHQSVTARPIRVVLGDLTFAYDLPSLAARPQGEQDVQIIVFDDGGGSIFQSLEHGRAAGPDLYERMFAVRQNADVVLAAEAFGWQSESVTTIEQLRQALRQPVTGRSILHLILPRPAGQLRLLQQRAASAMAGLARPDAFAGDRLAGGKTGGQTP